MCGWTTAHSLYILRCNMSKCEYVQVYFTMKKNGLILQSVTTGRGELASRHSGIEVSRKKGKQTLSIWWASRRSWIQLHKLIWTVSQVSSVNKKPVHYCLQDQAPRRQWPTESKQKTTTQKGEKGKKPRIQTLEKTLIQVLDKSHITGVFAFPSNIVWVQGSPTFTFASSPSTEAILMPHIVENSPGITFLLFTLQSVVKKKCYKN